MNMTVFPNPGQVSWPAHVSASALKHPLQLNTGLIIVVWEEGILQALGLETIV